MEKQPELRHIAEVPNKEHSTLDHCETRKSVFGLMYSLEGELSWFTKTSQSSHVQCIVVETSPKHGRAK
jgi:hypothetical protein